MAKIPIIGEDDELYDHYYSDTICGLVEYLDEKNIIPEDTTIISLYSKKETELDKGLLLDSSGEWLKKPHLCAVLEDYYERTGDERYKGHIEKHDCSFDDRKTQGEGPY